MDEKKELSKQRVRRRSGGERFIGLDSNLLEFWEWAHSDIMSNTERGRLAEFIVSKAVGAKSDHRVEWDVYDAVTPDKIKIEVKTSAYLQTWKQYRHSAIIFDIAPKKKWHAGENRYDAAAKRHSDVYVFCLFAEKDGLKANTMDIGQWEFYVLATRVLDEKMPTQKTITMKSLLNLGARKVEYCGLNDAIHVAYEVLKAHP